MVEGVVADLPDSGRDFDFFQIRPVAECRENEFGFRVNADFFPCLLYTF